MNRNLSYYRDVRNKTIARKKFLAEHVNGMTYPADGYYAKGKIHCSCGMCSRYNKTNNKGKHRYISYNYAKNKNWSHRDLGILLDMTQQFNDFITGNDNYY